MNQVKLPSIVVVFFCAIFMLFFLHQAQAEVPKLINYQGKLTTPQGAPLDTTVSMQFSIYPDSTGGDPLWTETQASVKVDKGIFNVLLGSVNEIPESVFTGNIRYLGVKVGGDPEMTPRKAIVSVGYAYNSDKVDGRHAGNKDGDVPVNNGVLNTNLNADYLDGFDSQAFLSPVVKVVRDTVNMEPGGNRTKELPSTIDPSKSVVILGQTLNGVEVWGLTSTSIILHNYNNWVCIGYQIIEYK